MTDKTPKPKSQPALWFRKIVAGGSHFLISIATLVAVAVGRAETGGAAQVQGVTSPPALADGLYVPNRTPLQPVPFMNLPPGAVVPKGWLRHQLELDARGIVGRFPQISRFLKPDDAGWIHPEKTFSVGEEVAYWFRGYCELGYALQDAALMQGAQKWFDGLMATVKPDGYLGAEARRMTEQGKCEPYQHMAMMFAFRSYYDYTQDPKVLAVITGFYKWMAAQPDGYFGAGWAGTRWASHLTGIYWLYNRTGESWLLDLAKRIRHLQQKGWFSRIPTAHNVNFAEGFRLPALYWQQEPDPQYLQTAIHHYQSTMDEVGQFPGGGFAGDEGRRPGYSDPRQGFETCGYVELMNSFEELTRITGQGIWADRCEEIAFNSLPAAVAPDHTGLHYISCANLVQADRAPKKHGQFGNGEMPMLAFEPSPHFYRCCSHNYSMGWPYYTRNLWLATADRGLCASLYAACDVKAKVADGVAVTIAEQTDYPFGDVVNLKIQPSKPTPFPLYLRIPRWCQGAWVEINGQKQAAQANPLSYLCVTRNWNPGDTVTLHLPMALAVRTWAKNHDAVSVDYGPLTFSLDIGEKWATYEPERFPPDAGVWNGYEVYPTTPWNYGLALDPKAPVSSVELVRKPGPLAEDPFTHEGAPLVIRAKARKIPGWQADSDNVVGPLQASPARTSEPIETVNLIPMGAAHLRITSFPVVTDSASGHEWTPPPRTLVTASSSYSEWPWFTETLMYGQEPVSSHDNTVPHFTWWNHCGTREWIKYKFPQPVRISAISVYWFDDRDQLGSYAGAGAYRVPHAWRVEYHDGNTWRPVEATAPAGVQLDAYNRVEFTPVVANALRLVLQLERAASAGLYVWKVYDTNLQLVPTQTQAAVDALTKGQPMANINASPAPESWFKPVMFKDIAEGQQVTTWRDDGGGCNDAKEEPFCKVPTAMHNLVNGQPMAHFDASKKQMLSFARTVEDDFSIAVLFRSTQGLGTGQYFFQGAGLVQGEIGGNEDKFGLSLNAKGELLAGVCAPLVSLVSPPGYNDGKPHLAIFTRDKTSGKIALFVDGKMAGEATAHTRSITKPTRLGIGATLRGENCFTGEIGEIMVFARTLAEKDRKAVEAELMTHWGIE